MSESSDELTGPDLEKGVEISSVGAGQMVAGHAFGEPVLLVHVEPNWFALGAKCTHYGAPLSEGALVGETIRCPWHHACFELRNGAASAAPALNDLPMYDVTLENNIVASVESALRPIAERAPAGRALREFQKKW